MSDRSARPTTDLSTPDGFIAAVGAAAQQSQKETKVPASVTIAQAILESDWGNSLLSKKANNYFGIKASSGPGPAGVIRMSTWEVIQGANVTVAGAFKFTDDPAEFARQIAAAGYATDPAYASKLISLIQKFGLDRYDLKPGS